MTDAKAEGRLRVQVPATNGRLPREIHHGAPPAQLSEEHSDEGCLEASILLAFPDSCRNNKIIVLLIVFFCVYMSLETITPS